MALKAKGFDVEVDGVLGSRTRRALITFQRQQGFEASGRIDSRTTAALGVSSKTGEQGKQPGTTGQGGDNMQKSPADQNKGAGTQGNQSGSQPATTGQGSDKMQKSPADQNKGAGAQGSQNDGKPSTTGQGGDKMQKSPVEAGQAPQNKNSDGSSKNPDGGNK